MMRPVYTLLLTIAFYSANCQPIVAWADSIRKAYKIPELGLAVVSSDSVYTLHVLGYKKASSTLAAAPGDKFRIGSNTKAITGFIAALLVKQGKISWNTRFFDMFPEMKRSSNPAYYHLTLLDLLSMRTKLFSYTYTYEKPTKGQFAGDEAAQRYQFTKWFLGQKPVATKDSVNFSNLGYVAAGLMLEKASGKSYKQLVKELGTQLNIDFGFGQPNAEDKLQPWGHNAHLQPEAPMDNYKLNWLLAAGNINVSLPDYAKFIQLQLKGLSGKSGLLPADDFYFLHYGLSTFSVGWFWRNEKETGPYSYNIGNPGTFLTEAYVYKNKDRAYILFTNVQSDAAEEGLDILFNELRKRY